MRRLIIILLLISASCVAKGQGRREVQSIISADIGAIVTSSSARLSFVHSFAQHWSAGGSLSIAIPESSAENGGQILEERIDIIRPEFRLGVRFWPKEFSSGTYLSLDCAYNLSTGTDMVIGCGYSIRIFNFLGISAGYEVKIVEGLNNNLFNTKGIIVGIEYLF